MRSPFYFIVSPVNDRRYNNTIDIFGVDFIISTNDEDHAYTNREAVLIAVPSGYTGPAMPGDILLVHHNVFRFQNDMQGYQKSGRSFLKDDQYILEPEQFYMYKHNSRWHPHGDYCFAKISDTGRLEAELVYVSDAMVNAGFKQGDTVSFVPGCIYEFNIDGETLYRIMDKHITIKLNGKD